jgi:hypothetical protein
MANLSGHAAGNGGYRQGDPTVSFDSLLLGRQHHTKPGPRHGPTRLRGEDPVDPLLLGVVYDPDDIATPGYAGPVIQDCDLPSSPCSNDDRITN